MTKSDKTQTTTEEEKPIMVMCLSKRGNWHDLATVERREEIKEKREELRRKAKETI